MLSSVLYYISFCVPDFPLNGNTVSQPKNLTGLQCKNCRVDYLLSVETFLTYE